MKSFEAVPVFSRLRCLIGYEAGLLLKRKFKGGTIAFDRHFVCYGDSDSRGYFL